MSNPATDSGRRGGDRRDNELFLELLAQHEAQLFGFLCAIAPNFQDSEDLLQQTVMTMWQKFGEFEPGTSFIAWGCQIARFKAMSLAQSRREVLFADDVLELLAIAQENQEPAMRLARRRALTDCLGKLGARDRDLVEAAYRRRGAVKDLAAEAGRSAGGVYNSLARIRATLYRCIEASVAQEGV